MKRLPINISNFATMIEGNYVYVDKTKTIYDLLHKESLQFFLSRPRRFGKSLLISTLKELFTGNKALFKGTWIGKSDYRWKEYPVIHLDFSRLATNTAQEFEISLSSSLTLIGENLEIDLSREPLANLKLGRLIHELSKKQKVVFLIDEYDSPLLRNLGDLEKAQAIQKVMSGFFSAIKSFDGDGKVHAVFITGITKFSKTSIFSGMNTLTDLSMSFEAATLLGYTKEELLFYFDGFIQEFAQHQKVPIAYIIDQIQTNYNGYCFTKEDRKVYNPYSVLHCLSKKDFDNFWFETGTPSFLIELIKKQLNVAENLEGIELSGDSLGAFDLENLYIVPILFQTGYLTIQNYEASERKYTLGYPNAEVKDAFCKYLIRSVIQSSPQDIDQALFKFKRAVADNDMELFCTALKSLLASIPYQLHIHNEAYYHSLLHLLATLIGIQGQSEVCSSKGRIDMVISTPQRILLFEFKFNKPSTFALKQIMQQKYFEKYQLLNKPITLVGLSFNIKKKELVLDWVKDGVFDKEKKLQKKHVPSFTVKTKGFTFNREKANER